MSAAVPKRPLGVVDSLRDAACTACAGTAELRMNFPAAERELFDF